MSQQSETADLPAPPAVRWIVRTLEEADHETWAVGGAVRDALAGNRPGDWDLATAARPGDMRRLFRRTVPIGIEHGTVGILSREGRMFEVTTFRRDVETDGRHATVSFSSDLDEDLARRDFTINAIAWHPLRKELRDPYGGREDLRGGRLRTVGRAGERFAEDRLRILRAFRFAGRFDLTVDPDTWRAAELAAPQLTELSAERVREELVKVLALGGGTRAALDLYARSGALAVLYPEMAGCPEAAAPEERGGSLWDYLLTTVTAVPPVRHRVRLAALLHAAGGAAPARGIPAVETGGAARRVLTRLRSSNAERDDVTHLVVHLPTVPDASASDIDVRRWLSTVGADYVPDLIRLAGARDRALGASPPGLAERARRIRNVLRTRPPLAIGDLAIGGRELQSLGIRPGPRYGRILAALLELVLEDPAINRADRLVPLVRELTTDEP